MAEDKKNNIIDNKKKYSNLAIASGIMGLLGLFLFGPFLTIPALITGILALRKIKKDNLRGKIWAQFGIGVFIIQTIFILAVLGYVIYTSGKPEIENMARGEDAIKKMSLEETEYLNSKLKQITAESTTDDVINILGAPRSTKNPIPFTRYYYNCPPSSSSSCAIVIDFLTGKAFKISFMDTKRFSYSIMLNENENTKGSSLEN